MRERIFDPLGMKDIAFRVPREKADRLAAFLLPRPRDERARPLRRPGKQRMARRARVRIRRRRLRLDHRRLSRLLPHAAERRPARPRMPAVAPSVELMMSDQLAPEQRAGSELFFGEHSNWGFGAAVDTRRKDIFHTPGRYG